jgi:hypothetical protein
MAATTSPSGTAEATGVRTTAPYGGSDAETVCEESADVLAPMGCGCRQAKAQVVHMSDGFDYIGFHIRWKRKRGTGKWYVHIFIGDRPIRSLKTRFVPNTPAVDRDLARAAVHVRGGVHRA